MLRQLGFDVAAVALLEGVSSSRIRAAPREVTSRRRTLLGRPPEVEGTVVLGDGEAARSASDGEPRRRRNLLVPAYGIYAGAALASIARPSRSGRIRTTAATSAGSRPSCSISRETSTAGGSWIELWQREGRGLRSEDELS